MADNLGFDIIVKSQQARDELELMNSKIRSTRKEVKALADEANKDPVALAKFRAANVELTRLNQTATALNKTIRGTGEAAEHTGDSFLHMAHGTRPINRLINEFQNLSRAAENASGILGLLLGGTAGGFAGLALSRVLGGVLEQANKVSEALVELKKTAGEIGVRPIALQATREAAQAAGHDAADATKIMQGLGKIIEENRAKFGAAVGGAGLPPVLGGGTLGTPMPGRVGMPSGTVRVGRGGVPGLTDPTKALDDLDLRLFPKTAEGVEKAVRAIQVRLVELKKTMNEMDWNIFAKAKFGVSGEALGEMLQDTAKLQEAIKGLQTSFRGATEENIKQNDELIASQAKAARAFDEGMASMAKTIRPVRIFINEEIAQFFDESAFSANMADFLTKWGTFWSGVSDVASAWMNNIKSNWNALRSSLSGLGGAVGAAFSSGDTAAAVGGLPFARGGMVSGPGTSTSDSILARLSAGEFVLNAASVRRLGLSFLTGLNGFGAGGLVGVPKFAEGGMVSGGTPVHLHLGGQSFALSGHDNVVNALVAEAARQQTRSAGVKPSWFGGRAGGH